MDIKPLLGDMGEKYKGSIRLRYGDDSHTLFWVPASNPKENKFHEMFLRTIEKIEPTISMGRAIPNERQYTEIDAVHIKELKKGGDKEGKGIITFLDAKLMAKSSTCVKQSSKSKKKQGSLHPEDEKDKWIKKCHIYSKGNCDYWKSDPFKESKSLIEKYFNEKVVKPENVYGKIKEETAFCNKYFQLMRNWIFGNVLVDTDGPFEGWDFHLIHIGDINYLQDMTFYIIFKNYLKEQRDRGKPVRTFAITTWQNTSSAIFRTFDKSAEPFLEWLSNHPVTGGIYGQREPLFSAKDETK